MILGFKTEINGKPTIFPEKILKHLGREAIVKYVSTCPYWAKVAMIVLIKESTPKKLTIRDDPHFRWQPGTKIHFATGVRTKNYECFAIGECIRTAEIMFNFYDDGSFSTEIDGHNLSHEEFNQLTQDDGFDTPQDFINFHMPRKHPEVHFYPKNGWMRKRVIYF